MNSVDPAATSHSHLHRPFGRCTVQAFVRRRCGSGLSVGSPFRRECLTSFACPRTMTASADSPPGCPVGVSPGKNALRPGTNAAFTSATEPSDFAVWCQLVASRLALLCGSGVPRRSVCAKAGPSARRFPLAFLPPVRHRSGVGFEWSVFHVVMNGSPTRDSHPIYNAPMLGAHQQVQATLYSAPDLRRWGCRALGLADVSHRGYTLSSNERNDNVQDSNDSSPC